MDFMHDVLADGSKIRLLTIVDMFSRESVALEVDYGFKSSQVVEVLRRAVAQRGAPERIHCDRSRVCFLAPRLMGILNARKARLLTARTSIRQCLL